MVEWRLLSTLENADVRKKGAVTNNSYVATRINCSMKVDVNIDEIDG
jgi:hypothetical protein